MESEARKVEVEITDEGPLVVMAYGPAGHWFGVSRTTELACKVVATAAYGDAPAEWKGDGSPYSWSWNSKKAALESFAEIEKIWSLMIRCGLDYDSILLALEVHDECVADGYADLVDALVDDWGFARNTAELLKAEIEKKEKAA
jgi:hypothetical protein